MSSTGDVWIKVRFRRFRLIGIDAHLWSECDKQVRNGGGKTRSSHSQWSPTGLNDPVSDLVEECPILGAPETDGTAGATRNNVPDKHGLAHPLEVLDGESFAVDIHGTAPVAPSEGEAF